MHARVASSVAASQRSFQASTRPPRRATGLAFRAWHSSGSSMEAVRLGSMARSPSSEKLHALGSGPAAASWRRPAPAPSQHATHDIHASASVAASPFSGGGAAGSGSGSNGGGAGGRLGMSVSRSLRRSLSFGEWRRPLPWLRVPDELWGAVNALSAAANPSTEKPPRGARLSTQVSVSRLAEDTVIADGPEAAPL